MSFKKLLSLVLVLCMVFSFFPVSAFAENDVDEDVIEEVVEEVPAEEPAEAEEPAPEEPVAEEVVEEEIVFEEVVEEAETTSDEAMDATNPVENETQGKSYPDLASAVAEATAGDSIVINDNLTATTGTATISKAGLKINAGGSAMPGTLTITAENVVLRGTAYTGTVYVNANGLKISSGIFANVTAITATSGNITGGTFTSLSPVLLATGYGPRAATKVDYGSTTALPNVTIDELTFVANVGKVYYTTFEKAAEDAGVAAANPTKVVELLKAPAKDATSGAYTDTADLDAANKLKVKLNGFVEDATAIVNAPSGKATAASEPDSEGITTVSVVNAVAKVPFTSGTKFYGTFAAAAAAAVNTTNYVEILTGATLATGDTFALKATAIEGGFVSQKLNVLPLTGGKADIDKRVLAENPDSYGVKGTAAASGIVTYELVAYAASIKEADGSVTKYTNTDDSTTGWPKAVQRATDSETLVITPLVTGLSCSLTANSFIVIAKNDNTVAVGVAASAGSGYGIVETPSEDGKTIRYSCEAIVAKVCYKALNADGKYAVQTPLNYTTFAAAAAKAVELNAADENAEAYVTVIANINDTTKAANVYKLESGSLKVVLDGSGDIDTVTWKNVVAKDPTTTTVTHTSSAPYVFTASSTTYTVSFDIGDAKPGTTPPATQTIEVGKTATKPAVDPVYKDDTAAFVGWIATDVSGEGVYTLYDFDTPVTANVNLTALYVGASIQLLNGTTEYYASFANALTAYLRNAKYQNLVITPFVKADWNVDKTTLAGKAVRVANADLLTIKNDAQDPVAYNATATQTFTVFSFETPVAVIENWDDGELDPTYGTLITYDRYFATTREAAKAADGTRIVKVLNENGKSYEFNSDDKVTVLKIDYSSPVVFVATSAVEGMGVKEEVVAETTTVPKHVRYSLVKAAASITVDGETTYYDTFANAAAVAVADATATTGLKTIVLLANVAEKDAYTLPYGKQINVQKGTFSLTVNPGHNGTTYYAVVEKTDDKGVTNYKSVEAVASVTVTTGTTPKTTYFATFEKAAEYAFNPANAGIDPAKAPAVKLYKMPVSTDIYTASEGYIVVSDCTEDQAGKIAKNNLTVATGLVTTVTALGTNVWKLTVAPAVASITLNNGKVEYFNSVDAAVTSGHNSKVNPIVLLADKLSYELAKDNTLYVDKNGHDDFVVTKQNPSSATVDKYAILEETEGKVTTYSTSKQSDVVAHITFETYKDNETSGQTKVETVVFYTDFEDAVDAAEQGKYVIVLDKNVDNAYTMTSEDKVIKVRKVNFGVTVRPGDGLAVLEELDEKDNTVTIYTVDTAIASVKAKFGSDTKVTIKTYADLEKAVKDALNNREAEITLSADPAKSFVYPLEKGDSLKVIAGDHGFTVSNFTAPDGFAVTMTPETVTPPAKPTYNTFSVVKKVVSIGEGDDIQFFDSFAGAVAEAVQLERYKPSGKSDPQNPTAVITLWTDMKDANGAAVPYSLTINGVNSLFIKDQGYEATIVTAESKKFVEVEKDVAEGVDHYVLADKVATITFFGADEPTNYSSFAAAAEDAFNTSNVVVLHSTPLAKDVYQMAVGTLTVKAKNVVALDDLKKNIVAYGEDVALDVEGDGDPYVFTVTGYEAAIEYPDGNVFKGSFEQVFTKAYDTALVIIPMTNLKKVVTVAAGKSFSVANSEYDVEFRADGEFELVAEGFDPVVYTANLAVANVATEEIDYYDTSYKPVYVQKYFADFKDAIAYAGGSKVINIKNEFLNKYTATAPYAMAEDEMFWVSNNDAAQIATLLKAPDGLAVSQKVDAENYPNDTMFYCSNFAITLNGGTVTNVGSGFTADGKQTYTVTDIKVGDWINLDPYSDVFTLMDGGNVIKNYIFDGWTYAGQGTAPEVMPENPVAFTAKWKQVQQVSINWVVDGKVVKTTQQYPGEKLAVPGLDQLTPVPTKEGYRPDESNLWSPEVPEIVPETAALVFNMNWIKQYNVNFTVDGKSVGVVKVDANDVLANYKDQIPTPEKKGYLLDGWTLNGADFDLNKTEVTADLSLEAKWKAGYAAKVIGTSLNLEGAIGVFTFVEIPDELMNGIYAEITVGDKVVTIQKDAFKKSGSNYYFDVSLPAAEDRTTMSLKLFNADGVVAMTGAPSSIERVKDNTYTDSIYDYLKRQEGAEGSFAALAKAMRNYCEYARQNFGVDPSIPLDLDPIELNRNLLSPFALKEANMPAGISFAGMTLNMESATDMLIVFSLADGQSIDNFKFKIDNKDVTAKKMGSYYYVAVPSIAGAELDLAHTVSINDVVVLSNVSGLSYAYRGLGNASWTQELKLTLMALYYYNQAANDYFGK